MEIILLFRLRKKNFELNIIGNNDVVDMIIYLMLIRKVKKKLFFICLCIFCCNCKMERIGMNERRKLISDIYLKKNMYV